MRQYNSKQAPLIVYHSRINPRGWWCAERGEVATPLGWEFLEAGDKCVTRNVKKLGPHWVVKQYSPRLKLNRTLGILAPTVNVEKARQLAEESKPRREKVRERSRKQREKTNIKYTEELKHTIIEYLDFDPQYAELADTIAQEAAETATQPRSGRVGRTNKLTMKEKAELAARATIRHSYTGYHEMLEDAKELYGPEYYGNLDNDTYREVKQDANRLVDEFLKKHRKKSANA